MMETSTTRERVEMYQLLNFEVSDQTTALRIEGSFNHSGS